MSVGFVFPGQGSQEVGMLSEFGNETIVRRTLEEASDAVSLPLVRLVAEGPEDVLNRTDVTQPALLTASVALWRLWSERGGPAPSAVAGHSLGEYSALVCAGAIDFAAGVRLVRVRGQLMQQAVAEGEGAMAAVLGLDDEVVADCCAGIDGVVAPANYNSPGQVVIAGAAAAVDAAIVRCKSAGAKRVVPLAVSVPSHCPLMRPIEKAFVAALAQVEIRVPALPVVQNVDAGVSTTPDELRGRLVRQLSEPVQWTRCVQRLSALGVRRYVECGPGKVLAGMIKRIDRSAAVQSLGSASALESALAGGAEA
jgi:[acyl-carrier-protein] S-malonyltransferase